METPIHIIDNPGLVYDYFLGRIVSRAYIQGHPACVHCQARHKAGKHVYPRAVPEGCGCGACLR